MSNKPTLHRNIIALAQNPESEATSQKFWISPSDEPAYEIDLAEFFSGAWRHLRGFQARRIWTGDFEGRPTFGQELASHLREWTAIRLARRPIAIDEIKPPAELLAPQKWGIE